MIKEDYVGFETAKLLKEKGFDENCAALYSLKSGELDKRGVGYVFNNSQWDFYITAPTLQMAMKWLREVHKIGVFPSTYSITNRDGTQEIHPYGTAIINLDTHELMTNEILPEETYEEACEAAIKYCLENLI